MLPRPALALQGAFAILGFGQVVEGYPVVFRANLVGGALSETLASASVGFE
jgi:hypothetical protein